MAEVELSARVADWLDGVDPDVRDQILSKLRDIETFPEQDLKRLNDSPYHRIRVGDYRIVIERIREEDVVEWMHEEDRLFVRRIGKREELYGAD